MATPIPGTRVTFAICVGCGLFGQPPTKQDALMEELLEILNTPVTTATRTAQSSSKAPATVVTVTSDQIHRRAYRSLADVLRDLPEFKIDNRFSVEYYNAISIRGVMGQNKFVILMDGARIGSATNEIIPVIENFPVHFAKQIEIVYGPASALYGADAFTGIINIVTYKNNEATEKRNYRLSYGEDKQVDAALFWSSDLGKGFHFSLGAHGFWDDMPNMPKYYPNEYSGLEQALQSGMFNTIFGPKAVTVPYKKEYNQPIQANSFFMRLSHQTWSLSIFQNYSNVPASINYSVPNALPDPRSHVATRTMSATATHLAELRNDLSILSTITARKYDVDPSSAFVNLFQPNMEPGYKYASSTSFRIEEVINWTISPDISLTSGASFEATDATPWSANLASPVDTRRSISSQGILIPGAPILADFYTVRGTSHGIFTQAQYAVTPSWAITLGGRYDKDSRYGETFNPRLGVVWAPGNTTTFKALYGTAYLAPSPYAAFRHYGGFFTKDEGKTYQSSFWRLPNPGLKPEKAEALEVSFRTLLTRSLSLTINLFQNKYKDLHTAIPDNGNTNIYGGKFKGWPVDYIEVTGNQGKQTNRGGNIQLDYLLNFYRGRINGFLSMGRVDGESEDAKGIKSDLGWVTPNMMRAGFDLSWGPWNLSPILMAVGPQRTGTLRPGPSRQREDIPGYRELNITASYSFSRGWEAFLRINNALDARYLNLNENAFNGGYEFNGVPQAPRRIALGLKGIF